MRLFALGAGFAACLICATAQAACLKASAPDQIAEGRLSSVRITIEAYKLKEQAFILQLAADACLDGPDEFDKVEATRRIHLFSMDDALRRKLRASVGKTVRVSGDAFGEHTAHHHAPIVMRVSRVEAVPRKRE
jgi:hypothetical protein